MEILTKAEAHILNTAPSYEQVLFTFRTAARNCYQSATDSNNNYEDTERLVKALIKSGHCYDGDTEILTENGFIPFKKYNGERVATVDPDSREFVGFEYPKRIINDTYTGIIYDYSNTLGIKITDGHNLYGVVYKDTNSAHEYNYRLFRANSVGYVHSGDYRRVKTNGERKFWAPNSCKSVKTLDAYWELVGFWIGDGCRERGGNTLRFHLKKTRKIKYLMSLADRLGMPFTKLANNKYKITCPNIGTEFIEKYTLGSDKYLPMMDDAVAIYSIIHGLLNADGYISHNNSKSISTTSIYIKDWLCSFGTLAGIPTYLIRVTQPSNVNHKTIYTVGICSNDRYLVNDSRKPNSFVKLVSVSDMPVYCVTVTTGLIVVRHGECRVPVLCGNCSTLEFNFIPAQIIGDRNCMGQLTRHRLLSFCIESARYNNYKDGIKVIVPADMTEAGYETWRASCIVAESAYLDLLDRGCKPETARSVLPSCLATSIVCGGNIREWRHVFKLRISKHSQVDIREVMKELLTKFYMNYPVFFADQYNKMIEQGTLD